MDNAKHERIKNFLLAWGYKPDEINAYIRKVAPRLEYKAERDKEEKMNAFFSGILGKKSPAKAKTQIPEAATGETGIARDLWLMLGTGPDALTLEDIADYYAEHIARTQAKREAEAPSSMNFSRMLGNLNAAEDLRRAGGCAELIRKHIEITEEGKKFNMNSFISSLCAKNAETVRIPVQNVGAPSGFNEHLRNISADKRV